MLFTFGFSDICHSQTTLVNCLFLAEIKIGSYPRKREKARLKDCCAFTMG